MIGRTPTEAVRSLLAPLRQALSCVTRSVPYAESAYRPGAAPHELTLAGGAPVRLGGASRLQLVVKLRYRLDELRGERDPWRVRVVAYQYVLEDAVGREVIAYHWHPDGPAEGGRRVAFPHLHLEAGAVDGRLRPELARAHLPTGSITLADVVELAIADLAVAPLRSDWTNVLQRARAALGA